MATNPPTSSIQIGMPITDADARLETSDTTPAAEPVDDPAALGVYVVPDGGEKFERPYLLPEMDCHGKGPDPPPD